MRIAVVGAGAVGLLVGALMARSGHEVAFIARGASLGAIRAGVAVTAPGESFATGPLAVAEDPTELGAHDLVLVAVKAWQVEALAKALRPLVGARAIVVPVQNGVEAADHLAAALGSEGVVGGVCHVLATREAPGRVRYVGPAPHLTIGERAGGASARLERVAEALRAAGVGATVSTDVAAALWAKLLMVEPFGAVGAATRASIDVVRALPETRALLEQAMREVSAVAAGVGVRVRDDAVGEAMARIDAMPAGATTSMHRDLVEGRPSELDEQTGAVVRVGRRAGVARPVHDVLYATLLAQDARLRSARGLA